MYVIDNVSHTPSKFNHLVALGLTASYILADYVIAKRVGNARWFGFGSLALASLAGYILFVVGMACQGLIAHGFGGGDNAFLG